MPFCVVSVRVEFRGDTAPEERWYTPCVRVCSANLSRIVPFSDILSTWSFTQPIACIWNLRTVTQTWLITCWEHLLSLRLGLQLVQRTVMEMHRKRKQWHDPDFPVFVPFSLSSQSLHPPLKKGNTLDFLSIKTFTSLKWLFSTSMDTGKKRCDLKNNAHSTTGWLSCLYCS